MCLLMSPVNQCCSSNSLVIDMHRCFPFGVLGGVLLIAAASCIIAVSSAVALAGRGAHTMIHAINVGDVCST